MRMGGITYPQLISTPYHPSRRLYVIDYHLKACIVVEKCKINITGSNTRDAVEISSLRDGQIACQYLHFA